MQKPVVLRTLLILQLTVKTLLYVNNLFLFFLGALVCVKLSNTAKALTDCQCTVQLCCEAGEK